MVGRFAKPLARVLLGVSLAPYLLTVTGATRAAHLRAAHGGDLWCTHSPSEKTITGAAPEEGSSASSASSDCPVCHQLTTGTQSPLGPPTFRVGMSAGGSFLPCFDSLPVAAVDRLPVSPRAPPALV